MATVNITDKQIESTYQRVNWNAKNKAGDYPCRTKACYSLDLIQEVLNAYARLRNDTTHQLHVKEYTPKSVYKDDIAHKVALHSPLLKGATIATQSKVKAILYEWYYAVKDISKKKSGPTKTGGGTNDHTAIIPIITNEDNVQSTDGLVSNESFFDQYGLIIGGGILAGVAVYFISQTKPKSKKRK